MSTLCTAASRCFPKSVFRPGTVPCGFLGIFFSDGQFLLLEGPVFLQIVTHGFRLFPVHVRLRFSLTRCLRHGLFKFILLLPGKSVISGGKTGFLVLTLPVGFLPVYLFFPGVIVIFDLCQFLSVPACIRSISSFRFSACRAARSCASLRSVASRCLASASGFFPDCLGSICPPIFPFWLLLRLSLPLPPLFQITVAFVSAFSTVCHKLPDHVS